LAHGFNPDCLFGELKQEGVVPIVDSPELPDLYTVLIEASERAVQNSQFEVAYHVLASAFHCAQDEERSDRLEAIEGIALAQLAHINLLNPSSVISTPSAESRHGGYVRNLGSKRQGANADGTR
jgi:hypothetical protein